MFGRGKKDQKALGAALDLMEERGLFADKVDWTATRAEVTAAADDPEQLELALFHLVRKVGGPHSGVRRPYRAPGEPDLPTVQVQGEAAVVTLPGCPAHHAQAYAEAGLAAMADVEPERWIVDLRGNGGGSMWPMLAVVAPLLRGDGGIGAFVDRYGESIPWTLTDGVLASGGTSWIAGATGRREGRVSVLTDAHTAGAGEAVAVAFRGLPDVRSYGAATLGFSTGTETAPLPAQDLVLTVATSRFADRTGEVYGSRVPPDVPSEDPLSMALWDL